MSDEYIYTAALIVVVCNMIGFLAEPFLFGESRENYNAKNWLVKLLIFLGLELPVLLYVIKHLN